MTSPALQRIPAQTAVPLVAESRHSGPSPRPSHPAQSVAFLHRSRNLHRSILLRVRGSSKFIRGIAVIVRAHKCQDFPKVVGVLDDASKRRHGPDHIFMTYAGITGLLKLVTAQRDETKQRVVLTAVYPS